MVFSQARAAVVNLRISLAELRSCKRKETFYFKQLLNAILQNASFNPLRIIRMQLIKFETMRQLFGNNGNIMDFRQLVITS